MIANCCEKKTKTVLQNFFFFFLLTRSTRVCPAWQSQLRNYCSGWIPKLSFSSSHLPPQRYWNAHKHRPGQSPGEQYFDWGRTIRPEAHGTKTPHGSVILLASGRGPRHSPVGPKWFDHTVLETKFGGLNSLIVRVKGGDSSSLTPIKVS